MHIYQRTDTSTAPTVNAVKTFSEIQTSKLANAEKNYTNIHDANVEITNSFKNPRSKLNEVFMNATVTIDSDEESTEQSLGVASIILEKEDHRLDVEDQSFTKNLLKDTAETIKIGTMVSEPREKDQSKELKKLDDVSALDQRLRGTKTTNGSVICQKAYLYLIELVKKAQTDDLSNLVIDRNRLYNYDVVMSENIERLATPMGKGKIYIHIEEAFDIIHGAHIGTNHGGVLRMLKILRRKYQNITRDMLRMYLETCAVCQTKFDIGSRCHVDMIDMKKHQVDGYAYILVYHHHTKLLQLRPLKSKQVDEVATAVLDIFAIFGVPSILHTSRSKNFTSCLVKEICKQWGQIKIISGKPTPKQAKTVKIENMLPCWMKAHVHRKWIDSLRYLQVEVNTDTTGFNSHQATFGKPFSFGLKSCLRIPLDHINTEKELESVLYDGESGSEILSTEGSSEGISDESDEPFSDTSTIEDDIMIVDCGYSTRSKSTKSDYRNTTKKRKVT
nr:unnamed protein product [Callosobruchus analis]